MDPFKAAPTPIPSTDLKIRLKRSRQMMVDRDTKDSTIGPARGSHPSGKKPRKSRKKQESTSATTPVTSSPLTATLTPSTPTTVVPTISPLPPVSKTPSERISAKSLRARQKLKDSPLSKLKSAEPAPTSDEVNEDLKREWLNPFGGIEMWTLIEGVKDITTQTLADDPPLISFATIVYPDDDACGCCGDPDCWTGRGGVFEG